MKPWINELKNIGIGLLLFLAVVGAIGSIGWLLYMHAYVIAAGSAVVTGFAIPTWIRLFKQMLK